MRLTVVVFLCFGCTADEGLRPFTSDGCSLFPDASLIDDQDWCDCCFVHDLAYWRGGTAAERESADVKLRDCVLQKTQNSVLAGAMYDGVRFGGSPYFYNWYRWGYGWLDSRNYQPLTVAERELAEMLERAYFAKGDPQVCDL